VENESIDKTTPKRSVIEVLITISVALLLTSILVATNWDQINYYCTENGDFASNALGIERAKSLEAYAGPYSRFNFQHPGPIYFYYQAASEKLLITLSKGSILSPFSAHTIAQIFLNVLLILLSALVVFRLTRSTSICMFLVLCFLLMISPRASGFIGNTWGPYVVILPVFLSLLAATAFASGSLLGGLLLALSSSLAIQTHVGTLPVLGPVILFAFILRVVRLKRSGKAVLSLSIIAPLLLYFLAFIPSLLDVVKFGKTGGVYRLGLFILQKGPPESRTLSEAIDALLQYYQIPGIPVSYTVPILIFLIVTSCFARLKNQTAANDLRLLTLTTIAFGTFSLYRTVGPIYEYLGRFHLGIAAILLFCSSMAIFGRFRLNFRYEAWLQRGFLVLSFIVGIWFITNVSLARSNFCNDQPEELLRQIAPDRQTLYVITLGESKGKGPWGPALGLALKLEREGFKFCVPRRLRFLFGTHRHCRLVRNQTVEPDLKRVELNFRTRREFQEPPPELIASSGRLYVLKDP